MLQNFFLEVNRNVGFFFCIFTKKLVPASVRYYECLTFNSCYDILCLDIDGLCHEMVSWPYHCYLLF